MWTLPPGDTDFSARWQAIKKSVLQAPATRRAALRKQDQQRRARHLATPFLGATIRDDRDYGIHLDYIHFNPVKHGLVTDVRQWPYRRIIGAWQRASIRRDGLGLPSRSLMRESRVSTRGRCHEDTDGRPDEGVMGYPRPSPGLPHPTAIDNADAVLAPAMGGALREGRG